MKKLTALFLALVMVLSLSACRGEDTEQPSPKPSDSTAVVPEDNLLDASDVSAENKSVEAVTLALKKGTWDFAPFNGSGSVRETLYQQIYGTLMAVPYFGASLEDLEYYLAKSVSVSDDGFTVDVELFDYIHDNQGNSIMAKDVKFSYETAVESSTYATIGTYLESVEVTGDYSVKLTAKVSGAGVWEKVLGSVPIINQEWFESTSEEDRSLNPAVTGAYYIAENVLGSHIVLKIVEDFWQEDDLRCCYAKIPVETIYCDCIVEDSMRTVAMQTGEIDVSIISNADAPLFIDDPDYTVQKIRCAGTTCFLFNCSEGSPFADVNLRKAALYAVDWEESRLAGGGTDYAGGLLHDFCGPACGDYVSEWDNEDYFSYNVDQAKEYLTQAGYSEGNGPTVRLLTRNDTFEGFAVVAKSYLEKLGFTVEMLSYDTALYNTYRLDPTAWDVCIYGCSTTGTVVEGWSSAFSVIGENGTLGGIKDEKLQSLLNDAISIHDDAALTAFHDYVIENAYGFGISYDENFLVAQNGITQLALNNTLNPFVTGCVFAEDFQSTTK